MTAETNAEFVTFSQFNGIVCYGEILATVSWNQPDDSFLVRHWYDPSGDEPRKPFTLVEKERCEKIKNLPTHYVRADGVWP